MGAVEQAEPLGLLLDVPLGIGERRQRVADDRPTVVARNMRQRVALGRREGNRGRDHTLHRHGRRSLALWTRTGNRIVINSLFAGRLQSLPVLSGEIAPLWAGRDKAAPSARLEQET